MPAEGLGPAALAAAAALVAVAVALSAWQRLGLEREMLAASGRAVVQLLAVGLGLVLVIAPETPLVWSVLWVAGMVVFAGVVIRRRVPELPGLLALATGAYALSAVVTLGILFGLGVFPLTPRALVPLGGMMVGNSMNAAIVAARRVADEVRDKAEEIEVRLALGYASRDAVRPHLSAALRTALTPQVETTKAVGLVFLPGAMTGLILAGVDPLDAVVVQAVVMFLVLSAAAITATVVALGGVRRLFSADHRLLRSYTRGNG